MHVEASVVGGRVSEAFQPFERLDDYQQGVMADADAASFEDELFATAAAGQAEEVAFVDRVSLIGQYLGPRGGLDVGSTRQRVEQLIAAGHRVQIMAPEPADQVQFPPIDPDAELIVTQLCLDLRGYDALDFIIEKPDGTELKTFRDVQCDPETGNVYALCEAPLARISLLNRHIITRIMGTRAGKREEIGRFESFASPSP
jgi:hypothetical protein